jgi:phenylacetic acid degradation operon negative regulatory protein
MTYQTESLRPQAALLTLYGDYLLNRHAEIGIGSLITLLGNLGLSEQAVRSAVSRMCRAGLLKARRMGQKSYYSLDKDGHRLLTEGANRIFHRKNNHWDGSWNIVTYSVPEQKRKARDRLRLELNWMGYGTLSEATWISPYDLTQEVEELVQRLKIKDYVQVFQAKNQGFSGAKKLVSQGWDLSRIHEQYARFIERYQPKLEDHQRRLEAGEAIEPSECFVERFRLIHEYRKLPFFDPDLPREILPSNWLRPKAARLFQEYHDLLADKANDYFDSVFKEY